MPLSAVGQHSALPSLIRFQNLISTDIQKWKLATGKESMCNNVGGFARNQAHLFTLIEI